MSTGALVSDLAGGLFTGLPAAVSCLASQVQVVPLGQDALDLPVAEALLAIRQNAGADWPHAWSSIGHRIKT
jgi:hypothetical protein